MEVQTNKQEKQTDRLTTQQSKLLTDRHQSQGGGGIECLDVFINMKRIPDSLDRSNRNHSRAEGVCVPGSTRATF